MGRPKGSTNKKKNLETEILNDLENEIQNSELETEKESSQETETGSFSDSTGNQNSGGDSNNSPEQSQNDYLTDLSEIDRIIQKEKPQITEEKRGRKSKAESQKVALQIPGSLFVRMHVTVGANAISALDTLIAKKNAIPADMLYWDEKVIQEMAPVAEMAMKEMKFEENPVVAFYVMFGAQMISQYASLKALIRQALKENPNLNVQELLKGKK